MVVRVFCFFVFFFIFVCSSYPSLLLLPSPPSFFLSLPLPLSPPSLLPLFFVGFGRRGKLGEIDCIDCMGLRRVSLSVTGTTVAMSEREIVF